MFQKMVSVPLTSLWDGFNFHMQYKTFRIRVWNKASENKDFKHTSPEGFPFTLPFNTTRQHCRFLFSWAKKDCIGKLLVCRYYKLQRSYHSVTTCSCILGRRQSQENGREDSFPPDTWYWKQDMSKQIYSYVTLRVSITHVKRMQLRTGSNQKYFTRIRGKNCNSFLYIVSVLTYLKKKYTNTSTKSLTALPDDRNQAFKMSFFCMCCIISLSL